MIQYHLNDQHNLQSDLQVCSFILNIYKFKYITDQIRFSLNLKSLTLDKKLKVNHHLDGLQYE